MNTEPFTHTPTRLNALCKQGIHFIIEYCITPLSTTEDDQRHEFILNVILLGSIILLALLDGFILASSLIRGDAYRGVPFAVFSLLVILFIALLILSRKGYFKISAYILIALYYVSATYCGIRWGVELPLVGFGYVLTIVISSVLINTRAGLIMTAIVSATIISIGYLQVNHIIFPQLYWKNEAIKINDPIQLSIIFFLIMTIAWLSNREIERSLKRARRSEAELTEERNMLEIKVEERTKEIKQMQIDKIHQLYHFVEFGRLSTGLFHDLMNPLNSVVAHVGELEKSREHLPEVKDSLRAAVYASKRMGDFLQTIRKQIKLDEHSQLFSLNKEMYEVIDMLRYRLRESHTVLNFNEQYDVLSYGNPLAFHQIALNLISNAIDACQNGPIEPIINITLAEHNDVITLIVADNGCGISEAVRDKIFDPFFTTKTKTHGIGLGLSKTKICIEKDFGGSINFTSNEGSGTTFVITIPRRDAPQELYE